MKTILSLSLLWLASTASALQLYSDSICASPSSQLNPIFNADQRYFTRFTYTAVTSEVSYCSTGRAVEVDRFDIRYYR
jgi:hypothetical protein